MVKKSKQIPWNKGKPRTDIIGDKSPNWKGGKYISNDGYRMVKVAERFECSTPWKSYKREHTHKMELKLKRSLKKGEIVHYIDKDKLNNDIKNLYLTNQSEHRKAHNSLEQLTIELYKMGYVDFDRKNSVYYFNKKFLKKMDIKK